jgi:hypothetical protein
MLLFGKDLGSVIATVKKRDLKKIQKAKVHMATLNLVDSSVMTKQFASAEKAVSKFGIQSLRTRL